MNRHLLVIVFVVVVLSLTGCVSVSDQTATETSTPTVEPTTETPTSTPPPTPEPPTTDGVLEVHAINVGQADATLIVAPTGETMLIDSGDWRDGGETVLAYLDVQEITRIDHLVATHGHADHIGGHDVIIEEFETNRDGIGAAWDSGVPHTSQTYERYLDAIEDHDVTLYETWEGDEIPFHAEGLTATVVNPAADSDDPIDLHYNSVAIHVTYGETTALFTGDAEADAEARMAAEHGATLAADLYHAGHHGSSTSSSELFLDVVAPEMAIISSGYDSQYGHPHEEVLDAFGERGIATYWTGVHGSVLFESDGEAWTAFVQTEATTEPLALRDEPKSDVDPWIDPRGETHAERIAVLLRTEPLAEVIPV